MSYAICRVQKIKGASSVHGIQGHQRREWESKSNPDIDYNRKNLNYSLLEEQTKSFNVLADERIAQGYTGKTAIRKDAVKVVSALFTSDNEFFQGKTSEEQQKFFDDCYQWAGKRFGKDNIFSAVVHMDEATPHLHIEFVPLTADGRLSAKSVLGGRVELQRLQDDFYKSVGKPWGMERGERADLEDPEAPKPRKHLETAELKQKTAAEVRALEVKRDNLATECTLKRAELNEAKKECNSLAEKESALKRKIEGLENDIEKKRAELKQIEGRLLTATNIKNLHNSKATKGIGGKIKLDEGDYLSLKRTALQANRLHKEKKALEKQLEKTYLQLKESQDDIKRVNYVLENNPVVLHEFDRAYKEAEESDFGERVISKGFFNDFEREMQGLDRSHEDYELDFDDDIEL